MLLSVVQASVWEQTTEDQGGGKTTKGAVLGAGTCGGQGELDRL